LQLTSTPARAALSVWTFESADGARQALERLRNLQRKRGLTIQHAAIIAWPHDRPEPETSEFRRLSGDARRARIWPPLFVALLEGQTLRSEVLRNLGIDDVSVETLRAHVHPGASVLLVVSTQAVREQRTLEAS
jgi:uncharacterized membrane protein